MERLATLELDRYRRRTAIMFAAAAAALVIDLASKSIAVQLEPRTLLFHVSDHAPFGLHGSLILVLVGSSLAACVLPARVVAIGAGIALGGALGNLTSRTWWSDYGGSPDFIPFADGSTGNLADIFIVVGGVAMMLGALLWLGWTAVADRGRAPR